MTGETLLGLQQQEIETNIALCIERTPKNISKPKPRSEVYCFLLEC
jgi:hypothetical protein